MKRRTHTNRAMREIDGIVGWLNDDEARWHKVNWTIIDASHKICNRRGRVGHIRRQAIRHRLWGKARRRHAVLRRYHIPFEIRGNSPCRIKSKYTIKYPRYPSVPVKPTYRLNIPALIAAILIGFFILFIPIINRRTISENISYILTYFNPESFSILFISASVFIVIVIFCLFLLSGLGHKSFKYSNYAGYLSLIYFFLLFIATTGSIDNTDPLSHLNVTFLSYWIATFGVSIIGIVYWLLFGFLRLNTRNSLNIILFPIICAISLFLLSMVMPISLPSLELPPSEQVIGQSYSTNSIYHVGEIATNQQGQQGFAIISDDGKGHYTVKPVYLDNSQKGWHTNGKVDSQILSYQSVEQQYPVRWPVGRMDITHIPDRDPTIASTTNKQITTSSVTSIPTTSQKSIDTSIPVSEILGRHNSYRSAVGGANIPNLVWSSTLASSAQSWADYLGANNLFQHSGGNSENIAAGYSSWTAAIDGWGSEKSHFIYAPFGNGVSDTGNWQDVGHYTQIIWKSTKQCGCGKAAHPTYGTVYVCQYYPAGNVIGSYPY